MQLQYTSPEHTSIRATLAEGETLGNHYGPIECFVPTDGANKEYAEIVERGLTVEPFVAPT